MTDAEHDRMRELITKARNTGNLSGKERAELAHLLELVDRESKP